jgi:hypothetical protein
VLNFWQARRQARGKAALIDEGMIRAQRVAGSALQQQRNWDRSEHDRRTET